MTEIVLRKVSAASIANTEPTSGNINSDLEASLFNNGTLRLRQTNQEWRAFNFLFLDVC